MPSRAGDLHGTQEIPTLTSWFFARCSRVDHLATSIAETWMVRNFSCTCVARERAHARTPAQGCRMRDRSASTATVLFRARGTAELGWCAPGTSSSHRGAFASPRRCNMVARYICQQRSVHAI